MQGWQPPSIGSRMQRVRFILVEKELDGAREWSVLPLGDRGAAPEKQQEVAGGQEDGPHHDETEGDALDPLVLGLHAALLRADHAQIGEQIGGARRLSRVRERVVDHEGRARPRAENTRRDARAEAERPKEGDGYSAEDAPREG